MEGQYRNAAFRSAIGFGLVVLWTSFYDGPWYAWLAFVVYVAFTFGVAYFIEQKLNRMKKEAEARDDT
ncbi:MAG: hypothetical protein AAGP08_16045 [Pseudomonadota bacterium]